MNTAIRASVLTAIVLVALPTAGPALAAEEPAVVRFTAPARDTPDPAMKYYLLPRVAEKKPGNAVMMYDMTQQMFRRNGDANEAARLREQVRAHLDAPLDELPIGMVRNLLAQLDNGALRHVKIGSLRADADWGLELGDGFKMMLPPNISQYRRIAEVLALRARLEIVQGRFEEAVDSIKTGLAMGKHLAEGAPILITRLIGIAIEKTMLDRVADLIERGGPNMYWALAELPEPLIDIRAAVFYECQWLLTTTPEIRKAQAGILSKPEADRLLKSIADVFLAVQPIGDGPSDLRVQLLRAAVIMRHYEEAKRDLIRQGRSEKQVAAMPVSQVVVLYLLKDYLHWRDAMLKWFNLPYWQACPGLQQTAGELGTWIRTEGRLNPLTQLLPAMQHSYTAQVTLDRKRAALQTIESIRAFAARHGRLPKTLDGLALPVPVDPMTGKRFRYKPDGLSFTLSGDVPEGVPARHAVHFEIRLTLDKAIATTRPATDFAQQPWKGIGRFCHQGALAVTRLDLPGLNGDEDWQRILDLAAGANLPGDTTELIGMRELIRTMVKAGAKELYFVVNVADLTGKPVIVLPLPKGDDTDLQTLTIVMQSMGRHPVRRACGALVVASDSQMRAVREAGGAERPRLAAALAFAKGPVRIGCAMPEAMRTALIDSMPRLPRELGGLPTAGLVQGLQWACMDVSVRPAISARLVGQATGEDAAKSLALALTLGMTTAARQTAKFDREQGRAFHAWAKVFRPVVKGNQLVLKLNQKQITDLLRDMVHGRAETREGITGQPAATSR